MSEKNSKLKTGSSERLRTKAAASGQNGPKYDGGSSPKRQQNKFKESDASSKKTTATSESVLLSFQTDPKESDAQKEVTFQSEPASTEETTSQTGADTSGQSDPKSGARRKQRQKSARHSAHKTYSQKLKHDKEPVKPSERLRQDKEAGTGNSGRTSDNPSQDKSDKPTDKKLNRSKLRMEQSGEKLQAARERLDRQKPVKKPGIVKSAGQTARFQTWRFIHGKVHEVEHENAGTEAAHRSELAGETTVRGGSHFIKRRIRTRPARRVHKWERRELRSRVDFHHRSMLEEHPELKKNVLPRYWQKRKLKKQYQKQAKEAARQGGKAAKKTGTAAVRLAGAVWRSVRSNPKVVLIGICIFALIVVLQSCLGAAATIGNGITAMAGVSSYLAEDSDIDLAELAYTEWETDLQLSINRIESDYPGYDEYRYSIGDISHSPYELMAFLTAVYDDFTYAQVAGVLREIFEEQYTLEMTETTETRTETREIQIGEAIGQVRTTGYCACAICCGPYANGITASGTTAAAGRTIAVDAYNPIVPMGTKVVVNGVIYTVEDTGNLAASNTDFDIFFSTHTEALNWGRRNVTAYLAEGNSNTVEVTTTEEYQILEVTLSAQSFTRLVSARMNGEQTERYVVYMATRGNRQYLASPFDFNWLAYVSSYYGYRVHPTTGNKDYHKGVDIAVPAGTGILAGQNGTVTFAGDSGSYGLVVVLDDGNGLVSKYAHCSTLMVSTGQTVAAGDVIAKVGSTGNTTGAHLHLEVLKDGEYLNPLYFAVTNDFGSGPDYSGNPGAAMGDGSLSALIAEAERHLGKPYVFGASGPNSFDCSGFVYYVLNQSGISNAGRTTAQGFYNMCTPVSPSAAQPGDLIFFTGTYSAGTPVTHIGIYVGDGKMIHAGNPVQYTSINTSYWQSHFYSFGRLN